MKTIIRFWNNNWPFILSVVACGLVALSFWWLFYTPNYFDSHEPVTQSERDCVKDTVKELMSMPNSLGGHDQDMDDFLRTVHSSAEKVCCPLRAFEHINHNRTGKWKLAQSEDGR